MEKRVYEAPEAKALTLEAEAFICQSGEVGMQDYGWNILPIE